jgi:hypothetical protein
MLVDVLWLFLGVEVVKIAQPLIKPVNGRKHIAVVADMVLAELARSVTERFEQLGDCQIFFLQTFRRPGRTTLSRCGWATAPLRKAARPAVRLC